MPCAGGMDFSGSVVTKIVTGMFTTNVYFFNSHHSNLLVLSVSLVRSNSVVRLFGVGSLQVNGTLLSLGSLGSGGTAHPLWLTRSSWNSRVDWFVQFFWYTLCRWLVRSFWHALLVWLALASWYSHSCWLALACWYSRCYWLAQWNLVLSPLLVRSSPVELSVVMAPSSCKVRLI